MHILRLVLFGLAAIAALALALTLFKSVQPPAGPTATILEPAAAEKQVSDEEIAAAQREIEARLAATQEYAGFFERMKDLYPAEHEAFLLEAARHAAAARLDQNPDLLITEAIRVLRVSHGVLAAKADPSVLDHVFVVEQALLQALAAEDQHLCADFLYGGASKEFFLFSAANRELIASFAIASVEAIKNGEIKQIERPQPTPEDLQLLEDVMRAKGLDTPAIEAILDGTIGDPPLEDTRLCQAGQVYLDALAELPEPVRMRIYGLAVELMARS